jgi:hypothetical protein
MIENIIISLVGVNSPHENDCARLYHHLKKEGYTVKVLTSNPESFNSEDVHVYSKEIFVYLDKILFSLDLIEKYKCDVLYLDADKFHSREQIEDYIERSKDYLVTYAGNWPEGDFDSYKELNPCFKYLKEYCEYIGMEYKNWKTIWEYVLFFRKDLDCNKVRKELEILSPVFTYMSLMNKDTYNKIPFALGGAEGLALSISLDKLGIESKIIEIEA